MATDETLDFAPNYAHVIELDITPNGADPTWANALVGIKTCTPKNDETTSDDAFYHNLGATETNVEAVKVSLGMSGYRMYGDPCQDFVQSKAGRIGKERKTHIRWTQPDGTVVEGGCTLSDLVVGSGMGDANSKGDFSYTIAINDFTEKPGDLNALPEGITASKVSVAMGKTSEVGASVTPASANQKCHYAVADTAIATVDPDGVVTGVKAGTTQLTVKAASKPSIMATVEVAVTTA